MSNPYEIKLDGKARCQRLGPSVEGFCYINPPCGKPAKWAFHYRYAVSDLDRAIATLEGLATPRHDKVGFTCLCEECAKSLEADGHPYPDNLEPEWKRMICKCGYHPCHPESHAGWSPDE